MSISCLPTIRSSIRLKATSAGNRPCGAGLRQRPARWEKQPVELFFEAISEDEKKAASLLDSRIHLFCEPSIAPQYIEMLEKLSRLIDIELYVLNPCREYWFDIVDSRRLAYLANRQKDLYHETGNTLLASWGKQTKASLESMHDRLGQYRKGR